jgi:adenylate cyclase
MWHKNILERKYLIYQYVRIGVICALIYGFIEYFVDKNSDNPDLLIPLLIRASCAGALIMVTAAIFEITYRRFLSSRTFLFLLITRSIVYTIIITFWMIIINTVWLFISRGFSFWEGLVDYITDESYLFNLTFIFILMIIVLAINQINSLNKKGALGNFLLGRYNVPKGVDRIFCFADLKNSTGIAEHLGHLKYAAFLKDYYADVSYAIERCKGEVYQYIGDEVVIIWNYEIGTANQNCLQCFFKMKAEVEKRQDYYKQTYGFVPLFRTGMHCGPVTVTWVGGKRKEILYLGDVLNTAKRIQDSCKRLEQDYLMSKDVLDLFSDPSDFEFRFIEESILRGKEESIQIFTVRGVTPAG